jgi:hypothetical protein
MARDFSEVLQQAMEFYVAGQLVEARALLLDLVRADSKLEAGWMFLSYTLEDPSQKADCLRKVLALNPNNAEAKTELTKLESVLHEGPKAPPSTSELLKIAPAAAPAPAPGGELPHASPFTMDIDHANDDIAFMAEAIAAETDAFPPAPVVSPPTIPVRTPALKPEPTAQKPAQPAKPAISPVPTHAPPAQQAAAVSPIIEKKETPEPIPHNSPAMPAAETPPAKGARTAVRPAAESGKQPAVAHAEPADQEPVPEEKPKKKRNPGCTCATVFLVLAIVVAGIGVGLYATGNLPPGILPPGILPIQNPSDSSPLPDGTTPAPPEFTLPPEWTKTLTPTITPSATISPTPTLTHTPTLAPPDATVAADIARLREEVEDLRGLTMDEDISVYVVDIGQAETILEAELDRTGYRQTIQNEAKALAILGFIKPTYDLAKYAQTRLADGVMGFYMPSDRTIYIVGNRFAGMERWTFTHEFDHALVHHYYSAVGIMDDDPICIHDSQRCEAIRALVEGDAMLLMLQWLDQYATPYDRRDISLYPYPFLLPPEQNTPPFVSPSVEFSYYAGLNFVGSLWSLGNWARVNQVYENLPESTEQILHPQKYLDGEKPVAMKIPKLETALGQAWSLVKSDSLGEFMTYLLLAYGADNTSQIPVETAKSASEGWGGDHYMVFSSTQGDQLLLSTEWIWDTSNDATEFLAAMKTYLDKRFRGEKASPAPGDCWAMNQQTTCLFRSGRSILWVVAPDLETVGVVRSAYGGY